MSILRLLCSNDYSSWCHELVCDLRLYNFLVSLIVIVIVLHNFIFKEPVNIFKAPHHLAAVGSKVVIHRFTTDGSQMIGEGVLVHFFYVQDMCWVIVL